MYFDWVVVKICFDFLHFCWMFSRHYDDCPVRVHSQGDDFKRFWDLVTVVPCCVGVLVGEQTIVNKSLGIDFCSSNLIIVLSRYCYVHCFANCQPNSFRSQGGALPQGVDNNQQLLFFRDLLPICLGGVDLSTSNSIILTRHFSINFDGQLLLWMNQWFFSRLMSPFFLNYLVRDVSNMDSGMTSSL